MQRLGQAPDAVQRFLRDLPDFLQVAAQRRTFRSVSSGAAEHRSHRRENLTEFVVQFARDVTQRRLLRGDQFLRQFAAPLRKLGHARKQPPVPADHGKTSQQNRSQRRSQEHVHLPLHPIIDLDNALCGLFFVLAVLHQQPGHRRAQGLPAAPAAKAGSAPSHPFLCPRQPAQTHGRPRPRTA